MPKEYQLLQQIIKEKLATLEKEIEQFSDATLIKVWTEGKEIFKMVSSIESIKIAFDENHLKKARGVIDRKEEQFTTFSFKDFKEQKILEKNLNRLIQTNDPLNCVTINLYSLKKNTHLYFQFFVNVKKTAMYCYVTSNHIFDPDNILVKEKIELLEESRREAPNDFFSNFRQLFEIGLSLSLEVFPRTAIWIIENIYNYADNEEVQLTTHFGRE